MVGNLALWSDVLRDITQAENAFGRAIVRGNILAERGSEMPEMDREDREIAVGKQLHDGFCAMESVLERLVRAIDGNLPSGQDTHAQLIDRAANQISGLRPAMISKETAADMHLLRAFRHVMRHSYGDYDYGRAAPNLEVAGKTIKSFKREIDEFAVTMKIIDKAPSGFNR